jgi:protein-tyrosine phosphatase
VEPLSRQPYRILMVCMGNICRSPLAHAVLQARLQAAGLSEQVCVESAGTHGYHVGGPPDLRSVAIGQRHGYDLTPQRAQQLIAADADTYDLICVMDTRNLRDALAILGPRAEPKLKRLLDFSREPLLERDVPDPYYGEHDGFAHVLRLVEVGCDGLMAWLNEQQHIATVAD